MREDLLGYLLSALEPHEMRRVEQELCDDPLLQMELEELQRQFAPLDQALSAQPVFETPPDLIARTLASLPPLPPIPKGEETSPLAFKSSTPVGLLTPSSMMPTVEMRDSRRPSWSDLLVASLASVAVLGLLIPSIARGRYEARKTECQEHLRQLGTAITQYVTRDRREFLPQIAEKGYEAFAGIYASRLADQGLLDRGEYRWCPEAELPSSEIPGPPFVAALDSNPSVPMENTTAESFVDRVVRVADLRAAHDERNVDRLRWLQQTAGGSYSYTLGIVEDGQYAAPHYESRASFAVLGDSPIEGSEAAGGIDASKLRWGHPGNGANLLFEDGSVRFFDMTASARFPDHPFFNHHGSLEAGVNIDDASLAPSWRPPFITVRQR
jgi:hypothetical protein